LVKCAACETLSSVATQEMVYSGDCVFRRLCIQKIVCSGICSGVSWTWCV